MAVKSVNSITIGATLGFLLLLATLFNLHSRDLLTRTSDVSVSVEDTGAKSGWFRPKPEGKETEDEAEVTEATEAEAYDPTQVKGIPTPSATRLSFLEVALKHGTDKVTTHNYHYLYTKYLEPIRDRPTKMLEIGLGCDMNYGPGKSYYTWREYFPNLDLYYIEFDAECVERWSKNMHGVKVYAGSQENVTFLDSFINASGGGFDIIIDDGGHTMNQQIVSLDKLFPVVKPGGLYFCEDLATSYNEAYGALPGVKTMMMVIQELLHDLNYKLLGAPPVRHLVGKAMRSVDCGEEICVFTKKELEATEIVT